LLFKISETNHKVRKQQVTMTGGINMPNIEKIGKRRFYSLFMASLSLTVAFLIVSVIMAQRVSALTIQVNAGYEKALYEVAELLKGVQLSLEKLMVSGDDSQRQAQLSNIAKQCEGAQADLADIPLDPNFRGNTMKFVNQTGDYARVLATQLSNKLALTENDRKQLSSLYDACVKLNQELADIITRYENGEMVFLPYENGVVTTQVQDLSSQSQINSSYPVLLYDGPFSDAKNGSDTQLKGAQVSAKQAQDLLTQFVGTDRVIAVNYTGDNDIMGKCYQFDVQTNDNGVLTADVTATGGYVLDMMITQGIDPGQAKLSVDECTNLAQQFLQSRGFSDMTVSYWNQIGGYITINFAPTQNGVILYPDLMKVQVSLVNGKVIGIESANYLKNHASRNLVTPAVSMDAAIAAISSTLIPENARECVIPVENGEAQCWEISAATSDGTKYLVYIDVSTGLERVIFKVINENDGVLTQ
jgi:germination protein YpeB